MIEVEHQLAQIMQQNDPQEITASLDQTNILINQYQNQANENTQIIKKNTGLGILFLTLALSPILASSISGNLEYLMFCGVTAIPFAISLKNFYNAAMTIPQYINNQFMAIEMTEIKNFLIKTGKR